MCEDGEDVWLEDGLFVAGEAVADWKPVVETSFLEVMIAVKIKDKEKTGKLTRGLRPLELFLLLNIWSVWSASGCECGFRARVNPACVFVLMCIRT